MDRRERFENPQDALMAAFHGLTADLWTSMPGIVQSFDPVTCSCTVQLSIQAKVENVDTGDYSWTNIPLLVDCPVLFPRGGRCVLTFDISSGDECIVFFADRCIDAWWQQGGIQQQQIYRMHDLSDGFVFVGPRSKPNVEGNISTTTTQLRTVDGSTYIELDPSGKNINIVTPNNVNVTAAKAVVTASTEIDAIVGGTTMKLTTSALDINAPVINITGPVNITGATSIAGALSQTGGGACSFSGNMTGSGTLTTTGEVTGNGITLSTHYHSDPQGGNTGGPIG